ncbi:carbohydrate-binding protein [Microbacterium flavum]|uniref:carbohydrate-binding protein n=1 Tax=Microbacterium flavum TaxID=415216 RepID=UPI0024ACD9A8|nr:carbohydrate-binding protein [Microbacterium flavum]
MSTEVTTDEGGGQNVTGIGDGDVLRFDDVDFGATPLTQMIVRVASGAQGGESGIISVRLDSPTGPVVGDLAVASTGGWQSWRTVPGNLRATTGVHTVYVTFASGQPRDFVNLNWVTFGR